MTAPYYESDGVTLHLGNSLDILPALADASVDAIVCDPPYELGFMGKAWDSSGIAYNVDLWRHCWRVLKPGGHLLAFGGTRTYHRMTVAIEDAGFEIRDSLHWIYGSGFPKGQDIAKSIDRRRDDRAKVLQVTAWLAVARDAAAWTNQRIDALWGFNGMAGHWTTQGVAATVPTPEQWDRLREELGFDDTEIRPLVAELNARRGTLGEAWLQREVIGQAHRVRRESDVQIAALSDGAYDLTAPASAPARQWQGWNTALKPAHEPIVLARKSTGFNTTVANVLEHGTGALNIDGCRTQAGQDYRDKCASVVGLASDRNGDAYGEWTGVCEDFAHPAGRWPTNVLLGHGPDCDDACSPGCPVPDFGAEARFFPVFRYEAKAPASERPRLADGTAHTTVKPLALMQWLVRLVTPPGGTVLDPFAGSGTTLAAALREGMTAVGVEKEEPYAQLCVQRLSEPYSVALFSDIA
ncbi:DNA methylase N-4/N-6 domain protein [Actinobacteria bacterium OV320]|jgi:DNA modification methylase|nr:DNA methylase N-4/N-6 domain protein [Actinobacteria bacterium OV320]